MLGLSPDRIMGLLVETSLDATAHLRRVAIYRELQSHIWHQPDNLQSLNYRTVFDSIWAQLEKDGQRCNLPYQFLTLCILCGCRDDDQALHVLSDGDKLEWMKFLVQQS